MAKRHRWLRRSHWNVCRDCGCRYRHGNISREYEQPDGRRTFEAETCVPRMERHVSRDHMREQIANAPDNEPAIIGAGLSE